MKNGRRRPAKPKPALPQSDGSPGLQTLANQIRSLFIAARQDRCPGAPGVGDSADTHFRRAAELATQFGETAEQYVGTMMAYLSKTGALFYPSVMGSAKVALAAHQRQVSAAAVDFGRYVSQLDKWQTYMSLGCAADLRSTTEFSPLVCFVLARAYNQHDVAEAHRAAAAEEFRCSLVAQELFGEAVGGLL
jgi:hypothetical protein